jgi:hypothetical protein
MRWGKPPLHWFRQVCGGIEPMRGKIPAEHHGAIVLGSYAALLYWYGYGECGTISRTLGSATEETTLCYNLTQGSERTLLA